MTAQQTWQDAMNVVARLEVDAAADTGARSGAGAVVLDLLHGARQRLASHAPGAADRCAGEHARVTVWPCPLIRVDLTALLPDDIDPARSTDPAEPAGRAGGPTTPTDMGCDLRSGLLAYLTDTGWAPASTSGTVGTVWHKDATGDSIGVLHEFLDTDADWVLLRDRIGRAENLAPGEVERRIRGQATPTAGRIEELAEVFWRTVDDAGIRGRLYRPDCTYLAQLAVERLAGAHEGGTR